MKKWIGFTAVSVFLLGSAVSAKVGYVDIQGAVASTKEGRRAKKTLDALAKKHQKTIAKQEKRLKKLRENLEKKKLALSAEKLAKKQEELQIEFLQYQKAIGQGQLSLQKKQKELLSPIMKKMEKAVQKVAKQKGYSLIVRKEVAAWGSASLDITKDVAKAFRGGKTRGR